MTKQIKYKNTDLEWCPQIPEHWELKKLKYVALVQPSNVDKKTEKDEISVLLCNYVDVYKNDYIVNSLPFMEATAKNNEIEKYQLVVGDVIITKDSETAQDIAIPAYVKETAPNLLCGYHLAQIRSNQVDIIGKYLFRLFQSKMFNSNFEIGANGVTRYGLGVEVTQSTFVLLPPLSEQQKIADYLDQKTTLIDSIIAKKEKQIELYKEERTAVINHAITKGLNPDAKMKDSGIEWLGEIPEHWELRKISQGFSKIGSGTTPSAGNSLYYENGVHNWLQTGDLTNGLISKTSKKLTDKALEDYSTLRFYEKGSLVIAMYGATIGKVGILNIETTTNQACCVLSSSESWLIMYAYYWFIANKEHVVRLSYGGGQPNISQEVIRTLRLTTPPISEQQQIISYLDKETLRIDALIEKTTKQIDLLKEYKEALINEFVTGHKIID